MRRFAPLAALVVAVPLLAFGPHERIAPTRWALVIGISDYIHFDDVEGGDLPGAEHDARGMRDVLVERQGFPAENVKLLLNRDATRAAIEEGITSWLAGSVRPGDHVTIFFAGHGSQVWDESGDEDDGLDETLAPSDVSPTSPEFDISDDQFGAWLRDLPTDNVVVYLDNCNSGTGTRDVTPFSRSRQLGRAVTTLEKPASVQRRALPGQEDRTGFDAGNARVLELAAAQPHQQAVDAFFPGGDGAEAFHGGAFTTYLIRQLWRAPADASYEEVFHEVQEALKRNRFQQDPYLSEDVPLRSLPLFFVEGAAGGTTDAALSVRSVDGGTAELGGGLTLGITRGSVFEADGATMVVRSVTQGSSTAEVVAGSVAAGDEVRLTGYHYPSDALRVNVGGIDGSTVAALRTALSGSAEVQLVDDPEAFGHLLLRRQGNALRIVGSDGFVRHDGLPVGANGAARLASLLGTEAAAKRLGDMENPAQPFGLTLGLLGGKTRFGLGEDIGFTVTSGRAGYVTLVDLGTDGTVAVLLPNADVPSMRIGAGETVAFPAADAGIALQALPPAGRGLVRAFVTAEPLRIDIPSGEVFATGGNELAAALTAEVRRAAGSVRDAVRLDSWATAAVVYDIHN